MHLYAVKEMLPFFASTGHDLYVKSAYIYIYNKCRRWKLIIPTNIHLNIGKGYHVEVKKQVLDRKRGHMSLLG